MSNSRKPRVLMIGPLPPPVHGSAVMTQYIKESKIINAQFELDWVNLSTSRSMEEIGSGSVKKAFRFASSFFRTFWLLATRHYDCAYIALTCHGVGFLKDAPFALLCKLFGRKLIIHQHNKGMSRDVDKPLYRRLFKTVYRNAKVVLLSWRLYPDVEKIVARDQVVICPNGIPETEILPKRQNAVPRILFLSNLIESKGVLVLLDACKLLADKGIAFECVYVGGETAEIDRERFEAEVRSRGLDKTVLYLGRKYGHEKQQEFANADIFALPTLNDTFGLVLLEAMQQRAAVVSTPEGGIPDIITDGKNGLLVEQNSPEQLAAALQSLIEDPALRQAMGVQGYETFKAHFSQAKYEECINCLLSDYKIAGGG